MKLRVAKARDQQAASKLLMEVAQRLQAKGSQQWQQILNGSEEEIITQRIANETLLVAENEAEEVIALCYLYQEPSQWDQDLWEESVQPNIYYLHRVALGNQVSGQKIGQEFIQSIQDYLSQHGEEVVIRLDCVSYLAVLNDLYQNSGFQQVGVVADVTAGELVADFNLYEWSPK